MNRKHKTNQINNRFIPLVAAICFVCLLPAPAPAGPTTGQLQQQIDQLTAHVNRLRALIEDPNHKSYTCGIAAVSKIEDRVVDEYGPGGGHRSLILIDVLEERPTYIDALLTGPPQESVILKIVKSPSDNPLTSRDYQVDVKIEFGDDVNNFSVSPEDPIYSTTGDPCYTGTLKLRCELVTDWRIKIIIPPADVQPIHQIRTEAIAAIVQAHIEPYTESATETELKVHMGNYGDILSTYVVTATGFGPSIEPVLAGSVSVEPYEEATLTLPIRTVDNFAGQGPCLVTLKSNTGRRYDYTTADFPEPLPDGPAPQYIPDFDGDGDCDFGDFSYFSMYWLEQPDI